MPVTLNFLDSVPTKTLSLKAVMSPQKDKLNTLFQLVCQLGNKSTLVFCNHRESVERVADFLIAKQIHAGIYHGGLEQDMRERMLMKFRNGSQHLLITTDLASRGLDIAEVEYIIHYHLPATESIYTHRNGRTARMNANGTAYIILSEEEQLPVWVNPQPSFETLSEKATISQGTKRTTLYIGGGKKDKITKTDIAGFLFQKGKLQKEELGLIEIQETASFAAINTDKIKQVLQLIKNEPIKKKKLKFEIAR
jgi:ATP-independent RNA helicase DbpA